MIFKQLLKQYVIFLLVGYRPTRPTMAVLEHFCRFGRAKTCNLQKIPLTYTTYTDLQTYTMYIIYIIILENYIYIYHTKSYTVYVF